MLIGEYIHTIDAKKRVNLPVRFRKEMGKKVIVTRGLDHSLFVFSVKQWEEVTSKLATLSIGPADQRGINRFLLAGAVETGVDSIGRILIPEYLRDFAQLKDKVAVIGVHGRVEIWNDKLWESYKRRIEKQADALAEKLGEIGAL